MNLIRAPSFSDILFRSSIIHLFYPSSAIHPFIDRPTININIICDRILCRATLPQCSATCCDNRQEPLKAIMVRKEMRWQRFRRLCYDVWCSCRWCGMAWHGSMVYAMRSINLVKCFLHVSYARQHNS